MRIRQIRQDFFTDEKLAGLSDGTRLFYVGLWCVADDSGWFRSDIARIGALLYPYRAKGRRERDISSWLAALVALGRVVLHECGCGVIPTLKRHQIVGGKRSQTEQERHLREHADVREVREGFSQREVREVPEIRAVGNGRERNVKERNVTPRGRAREARREDETESEFQARVPRPA